MRLDEDRVEAELVAHKWKHTLLFIYVLRWWKGQLRVVFVPMQFNLGWVLNGKIIGVFHASYQYKD